MDFPPRSTFVQTFGETLKSLSLKTKAPGAAVTGRGNGELITHPEHSPGCSHSAQASSSIPVLIPSCRLHPHLCQEQTHGTEKQPKPQIQQGLTPDPSLGWKWEHVGWGGGRHSMRIPFASPLSKQTKSSPWRSAVCAMTFSRGPCRLRRTKLWQSLPAASGQREMRCSIAALEFRSQFRVSGGFGIILLRYSAALLTGNPLELSLMPHLSLTHCLQRPAQRVCGTPSF